MESNNKIRLYSVPGLIAGILLLIHLGVGFAQNCSCATGLCCSKFGFCGTTDVYCGDGCQSGPCTNKSGGPPATGGGDIGTIVSRSFFDNISSNVANSCEAKGFYTYDAFLNAGKAYSGFGTNGSVDVNKRELAAFFANAMHETGGFCYINERNPPQVYCQAGTPCPTGKSYHGRGPLQLSWNYNYQAAGKNIGFDGINNPEIVGQDATISFKTAVWFWMQNSNCHQAITSGQGFGGTIKAINSMECNGGNSAEVNSRVGYYKTFCQQFGVDPGQNVSC